MQAFQRTSLDRLRTSCAKKKTSYQRFNPFEIHVSATRSDVFATSPTPLQVILVVEYVRETAEGKVVGTEEKANHIGTQIIEAAIAVHSALGPGLLESVYENCLSHELSLRDLRVRAQVPSPLRYGDLLVENAYRIDLLIDELVVVEIKAVETIQPVHRAQILSYLRLGGFKLGYLLNFNVAHMREGIVRRVNGL